jgi:hypothetical protein
VQGDVEHGDAGALGGGKRSHGRGPFLLDESVPAVVWQAETGFRRHQLAHFVKRLMPSVSLDIRQVAIPTC